MENTIKRRNLIAGGAATLGFYLIGGRLTQATAAEATAKGFTPRALSQTQVTALEAIADVLVPGAKAQGIAAYIDSQLASGDDSKLIAKYLGVGTPGQKGFYSAALDAALKQPQLREAPEAFTRALATDSVNDWQGPPGSYFTFVLRADALDVVYGTPEGFESIGVPYMAHIQPETKW